MRIVMKYVFYFLTLFSVRVKSYFECCKKQKVL